MIISDHKRLDMMFQIYRDQLIHNPVLDPDDPDSLLYVAELSKEAVETFLKGTHVMNEGLACETIERMLTALENHNIKPNWSEEKADA